MAYNFNDPMQFMQMLFSPEMNPQMMEQMAGQLAMKQPPPPFSPAQAQTPMGPPGQGLMGLTPGPQMAQGGAPIPQVGLPPGLEPIPGLFPQGGAIMPGEEAGMPIDPKQALQAALSAQQMLQYQKMLEPSNGPVISPPSPPGGRQLGAMGQLQMPQTQMPMSLAALLGRR